jgi:hypothetical protein
MEMWCFHHWWVDLKFLHMRCKQQLLLRLTIATDVIVNVCSQKCNRNNNNTNTVNAIIIMIVLRFQ